MEKILYLTHFEGNVYPIAIQLVTLPIVPTVVLTLYVPVMDIEVLLPIV